MRGPVRIILIVFFACVFLLSGWKALDYIREYRAGQNSYGELEQYMNLPDPTPSPEPEKLPENTEAPQETAPQYPVDDTLWPEVDFEALSLSCPDIVGWLYIEGTKINYPVVQGEDNDYYLHRLADGSYNDAGSLFVDAYIASDMSEANTVIYGHWRRDGSMFYDLHNYKEQEFFDEHPEGLFLTPESRYKLRFFSGYVAEVTESAWETEFENTEFEAWLEETASKSCFDAGFEPAAEDKVVTLSTCSYEFYNARFIMHAVAVDYGPGEQ